MSISSPRALVAGSCTGFVLLILTGCGALSSLAPTPEPKRVPTDTILVADEDTAALDPEVARLYVLESELLAAEDSVRRAQLLNQAMAELSEGLRLRPEQGRELCHGLIEQLSPAHTVLRGEKL